jgi:hypothetical protein
MFEWLKDKTIMKFRRWKNRLFLRVIGELHKERMLDHSKEIPDELKDYNALAIIMNGNCTALHNLYRKARDGEKFQEAFLYFFYEFEINLKHMIMSEMMVVNNIEALKYATDNHFSIYSKDEVLKIQKIGHISVLIQKFLSIHGHEIKVNLEAINTARNFIIHNMLKEEMSEEQIEKSFENFFVKTNDHVNKAYGFFYKALNERPQKILAMIEKLQYEK